MLIAQMTDWKLLAAGCLSAAPLSALRAVASNHLLPAVPSSMTLKVKLRLKTQEVRSPCRVAGVSFLTQGAED